MNAKQSENLEVRTYRGEDDIPAIVALFNAAARVDGREFGTTEEEERRFLAGPAIRPEQNFFLFEVDGQLVACGRIVLEVGPEESLFFIRGCVHPNWRRRGIGTRVMERVEGRIQERLSETTSPTVYASVGTSIELGDYQALYRKMGYEAVRTFFDMERPLRDNGVVFDLPEPVYPPGIVARSMVERSDLESVWKTTDEAFRDHWGHTESTLEQWQHWTSDPQYRPERWLIAWDVEKDQPAGVCLNGVNVDRNERMGRREGWVNVLAVRRPYRRQGLGTALLASGLELLQKEGMDWAMLGVDTENLTGALRIYKGVGFRPIKRYVGFHKAMRS